MPIAHTPPRLLPPSSRMTPGIDIVVVAPKPDDRFGFLFRSTHPDPASTQLVWCMAASSRGSMSAAWTHSHRTALLMPQVSQTAALLRRLAAGGHDDVVVSSSGAAPAGSRFPASTFEGGVRIRSDAAGVVISCLRLPGKASKVTPETLMTRPEADKLADKLADMLERLVEVCAGRRDLYLGV